MTATATQSAKAPATAKDSAPHDELTDLEPKALGDFIARQINELGSRLTADQKSAIDSAVKAEMAPLTKQWDDFQKANPMYSVPGSAPSENKSVKDQWNYGRAAAYCLTKDPSVAPFELECHKQIRKTMTTVSDTSAGLLIPLQVADEIIKPLRDNSVARQAGVRFTNSKGYIGFQKRRRVADLVAQWVAETGTVTKSDLKYTMMELRPRSLRAAEDITNLMLEQAPDLVHSEIQESCSAQFELAGDRAILIGSGQGNEPMGVAFTPGVGTASLAGPTYDQLKGFPGVVRVAKALSGKASWIMSPEKFNQIEIIKDSGTDQPLERRMLASGPIDTLVGYPFQWTGQLVGSGSGLGLNAAIFGVWSNVFMISFGQMRMRVSDAGDTNMNTDSTTVAVVMYADVGVDQPKAFCVASA